MKIFVTKMIAVQGYFILQFLFLFVVKDQIKKKWIWER